MMRGRSAGAVLAAALCCAALGGCGGRTQSDGDPTRGPGGAPPAVSEDALAAIQGPTVDEIVSRLGLTEDQVSPVRSILAAAAEERSEVLPGPGAGGRAPGAGSRVAEAGDVLDRLADLDRRTAGMLQSVLSAEQLKAFVTLMAEAQKAREKALNEMVKSRRPSGDGPPGGRPGGPGGGGFPPG